MDLQALRQWITSAPIADLPARIGELEALKATGWARLMTPTPPPAPSRAVQPRPTLVNAKIMGRMIQSSPRRLREAADRGKIPATRVGRFWRFQPDDVLKALQERPLPKGRRHRRRIAGPAAPKKRKQHKENSVPATIPLPPSGDATGAEECP